MIVKLLTERHLEFLSLKGGCTGSSESTLVKMKHFWKSPVPVCAPLRLKVKCFRIFRISTVPFKCFNGS